MKLIEADTKVDIVIFTIVRVEFMAVLEFLSETTKVVSQNGTLYRIGKYKNHTVALRRVKDQGNAVMSSEVQEAIQLLQPKIMFLVGIAGGVKKVNLGDVVIVTRTYSYESGKETEDGFKFRDKGSPTDYKLLERARDASMDTQWLNLAANNSEKFKVIDGPIASGEKVITTSKTRLFKIINSHCEDAVAVEMEGLGFSTVLHEFPLINGINIRGISDLIDGKDKIYNDGFREKAAENAATFAFYLIEAIEDILDEEVIRYVKSNNNNKDIASFLNELDSTLEQVKNQINNKESKGSVSLSVSINGDYGKVIQAGRDIYNANNSNDNQLFNAVLNTLQEVRNLIGDNEIIEAFQKLSEFKSHKYENELIILKRAYEDVIERERKGILNYTEVILHINLITNNLLNTMQMIEREFN